MIKLRNIKKIYNQKIVLDIESLDIERGDICSVSGPNGSGKSTLLEIIGGLIEPTEGSIQTSQTSNTKESGHVRKKALMVLQNPVMFTRSIEGNLRFALKANDIPRNEHAKRIQEALELVDLRLGPKKQAHLLSGGERQRLAIARVLVLDPEILILDEPTTGLDLSARASLIDTLKEIHSKRDITMVVASHDMDFLLAIATNAFSLFHGKKAPMSVENLFAGIIENGQMKLSEKVSFNVPGKHEGRRNLVIAPEEIVLSHEKIQSSMRNSFSGKIKGLYSDEAGMTKVLLDIGIPIHVKVTDSSAKEMELALGQTLWINFKTTSVRIY